MEYTPFAGLTALDQGDVITVDGGSFMTRNPRITDHLLQVGAVTHRHDGHAAAPVPHTVLLGSIGSGGSLPIDTEFALTYTLTDVYGGETTAADPLVLSTGASTMSAPTTMPVATPDYTAGIMPAGGYYYAQTYTDGLGGETTIGPSVFVYVDPGFASAQVLLSGLTAPSPAVDYRLWRSYEGEDWHLLLEATADTFLDAGFDPPDNPASPPAVSSAQGSASITVTLPTVLREPALASAASINLYLAEDSSFTDPCLYAIYPVASAGVLVTIPSATVLEGAPPHVSLAIQGAAQLNPDTDILGWPWKRPVASASLLPASGNADGDMRETLDAHILYVWDALTSAWNPGGGAVGAVGPAGPTGPPGPVGPPASSIVVASGHVGVYTLALTDAGTVVEIDGSAGSGQVIIPAHASVAFPLETLVEFCDIGTHPISIVGSAGVTLDLPPGASAVSLGRWSTIGARQRAIDEWILSGSGLA